MESVKSAKSMQGCSCSISYTGIVLTYSQHRFHHAVHSVSTMRTPQQSLFCADDRKWIKVSWDKMTVIDWILWQNFMDQFSQLANIWALVIGTGVPFFCISTGMPKCIQKWSTSDWKIVKNVQFCLGESYQICTLCPNNHVSKLSWTFTLCILQGIVAPNPWL